MKILILICAALGHDTFRRNAKAAFWRSLKTSSTKTVFPALTCPVQASLRTGLSPDAHHMAANGFFDCEIRKAFFWEQSSGLYKGARFWEGYRDRGGRVAQICLQQSLGPDSDVVISPAPIHKHHGGMIQDCYSRPDGLYRQICSGTGSRFNLYDYWGPFTSGNSTEWIVKATEHVMKAEMAGLVLSYLPHLDYDLQRFGPGGKEEATAFAFLEKRIERLHGLAKIAGYEIIVLGDYQIERAENVVYPNRILIEKGFFRTRQVSGMLYPDMFGSEAFALCDHQVAHVHSLGASTADLAAALKSVPGVAQVLENRSGDGKGNLTLLAEHGSWFSYRWWESKGEAPEYASHVDIHNKPGFDPCELFMSLWPPFSVSQDDRRVKGTHGLADGASGDVLLASSLDVGSVESLAGLAGRIAGVLP